jgi:hypothetical protein
MCGCGCVALSEERIDADDVAKNSFKGQFENSVRDAQGPIENVQKRACQSECNDVGAFDLFGKIGAVFLGFKPLCRSLANSVGIRGSSKN